MKKYKVYKKQKGIGNYITTSLKYCKNTKYSPIAIEALYNILKKKYISILNSPENYDKKCKKYGIY